MGPTLCDPIDGSPLQYSGLENSMDCIVRGVILRRAGKARNPFQTTQGNRLSCRDQEGRRGSEEAVPGPSVFPSGDPGVSGANICPVEKN